MSKLIFNKPQCMTHACCNNDPNYPNNCAVWTNIDGCYLAQIKKPNHLQKILAWVDRHWLRIAVACLTASVFICWSLFTMGLGATSAIDDLRREEAQLSQVIKKKTRIIALPRHQAVQTQIEKDEPAEDEPAANNGTEAEINTEVQAADAEAYVANP
jgi:hypothetical protein